MTDLTEKMAEAYWNAYRDGYYAAGGKLDYPLWAGSNDPVRNETYRCMRFAAEVLILGLIEALNDPANTDFGETIKRLLPGEPMSRQDADALMSEANKPLLDVMRDANT